MTDEKTGAGTGQVGDHPKPDSHMAGGEHMSGGGHMTGGAHMSGGAHMAGSGPLSNEAGEGNEENDTTEPAPQAPPTGRTIDAEPEPVDRGASSGELKHLWPMLAVVAALVVGVVLGYVVFG